jgi:Zn-dependent M28 family amino/carboxypeptidase
VKTILIWLIVIAAFVGASLAFMTQMPGQSAPAATGPLSDVETTIKDRLKSHVETLAVDIGARGHGYPAATADTLRYLSGQLRRARFETREITFDSKGMPTVNLEGTLVGTRKKDEVLLLGANYDTDGKSPGAADNASGCGVLLEVARLIAESASERSVRVVFFGNGSGSFAGDEKSGAWNYAREARKRGDKIVVMLDFDSLGHFKDTPGSQSAPFPLSTFYPSTGNFVLFAGDLGARDLVRTAVGEFRKTTRFPCQGAAMPGLLPGMNSADYASFANFGFPALVVTDTGSYRFDKAGTLWDTVDRLDFDKMARAAGGIAKVVAAFARTTGSL